MLKSKKYIIFFLITLYVFIETNAQCAMCRAVLESEESQSAAKGINDGILYLMLIPYLSVAVLGYVIYSKFFKRKKA